MVNRFFVACLMVTVCVSASLSLTAADPATPPAGKAPAKPTRPEEDYYQLMKLFVDSFEQIEKNYVKEVDRRVLFEAALEGMMEKLDPYSNYIGPEEISRFNAQVEQEFGGIGIQDVKPVYRRESFISMDEPKHSAQRKTVQPMFMPQNLAKLAETIRVRACEILDNLPKNETFDWVDKVSVELTTQMLAILFDFPWEERRKLTRWSNVATAAPGNREIIASEQAREAELQECGAYFARLWEERAKQPMKTDLLSMMAHSEATRDMDPRNFLGNLILLIVGGNDTTRNSLSGRRVCTRAVCVFPRLALAPG